MPLWLLALIVARELMQLPMVVVYRVFPTLRHWLRYDFRASHLGKAATIIAVPRDRIAGDGLAGRAAARVGRVRRSACVALVDYVRRAVAIGKQRLHANPER